MRAGTQDFNFFFIIVLFIALSNLILDIFFLKIEKKLLLSIYFWLCWVFIAASGLSRWRARALEHRLVAAVHGLSRPLVCRIFLDQGSSLCPLH